jgi:hypothetical protein
MQAHVDKYIDPGLPNDDHIDAMNQIVLTTHRSQGFLSLVSMVSKPRE